MNRVTAKLPRRFRARAVSLPPARSRSPGVPGRAVRAGAWTLFLCALVGTACADRTSTADAGGEPRYGGTVVIAGDADLEYANSLVSRHAPTQEFIRFALFMPLLRYDAELGYEPYLAESWKMEGDTAVVFRLRRDVRWHDGARTTAYDVAFTFDRARDPETAFPNREYFQYWRGTQVLDSFAIRFTMEPHVDPLAGVPFLPIMPRHLLDTVPPARMRETPFNKHPVGNGPFRFVSMRANDRWVFEANPDFPRALGGRPYLDRLIWRVVPENAAQLTEILTGGVDMALTVRVEQFDEHRKNPELQGFVRPTRRYAFIGWNGKRPPLGDPRVRRALSMAIDRQRILNGLRNGYGELATGPVPPYHWAYDRSLHPLPFDTAAARALLTEAGLVDRNGDGVREDARGRPFAIELKIPAGNDYNRDMAEMIRADLAAVGVRLTTRPTEGGVLIADISSPERRFDAVLLGLEADFRLALRDPFHSAAMDGPFQLASYSNPEVDDILDRVGTIPDRESAIPLWHRLQRIMLDEQPWTFLYYSPEVILANRRIRGVEMDIRGLLVNLPHWWVADPPATAMGGEEEAQ